MPRPFAIVASCVGSVIAPRLPFRVNLRFRFFLRQLPGVGFQALGNDTAGRRVVPGDQVLQRVAENVAKIVLVAELPEHGVAERRVVVLQQLVGALFDGAVTRFGYVPIAISAAVRVLPDPAAP